MIDRLRQQAALLGEKIRAEDGIANVVDIVQKIAKRLAS
jgi:hypothetical protein